jgi:BAH domain
MMMSLFWYYRPEHTEQGRLENDASDEVFASRHKDHNSVACIEDKCFVLTYNEYCRSVQLESLRNFAFHSSPFSF